LPGIENAITSNEAMHLSSLPASVAIVGGGYIALEFATIFAGLGANVVVLYRGEQVLRGFDDDVRRFAADELRKRGVDVRVGQNVSAIERSGNRLTLRLADGARLGADQVMYATGRRPNTAGMGLERAGVALESTGAVKVDAFSRSNVATIHAIGDCTDRVNLTPVAIKEGHAFADTVFGDRPWPVDHADCPSAVFTIPPIGVVGLSEANARRSGKMLDIYRTSFRPMKHTLSGRNEGAFMKLVVDRQSQVVLGAHMVGEDAPEIIQALAVAVKLRATKADFDRTMAIHPTAAEEFVTMREKAPE
jgi:glutathione reductase (NADPH)